MGTISDAPKSSGAYIRAGWVLISMVIIAEFVSLILVYTDAYFEDAPHINLFVLSTRGTISLVTLPVLIIVPWRMIQRHRRVVTNIPIICGTVVFSLTMIAHPILYSLPS